MRREQRRPVSLCLLAMETEAGGEWIGGDNRSLVSHNNNSKHPPLDRQHAVAQRKRVDRKILPWVFSIGVLSYIDRTNLAFAAVELNRDLGYSCKTYGLGAGMFFVGYGLCQVPSVTLFEHYGIPWLALTVCVWGFVAASFSFLLSTSTVVFLILRVLLGMCESGTFPIILSYLSHFYSPEALGTAYSVAATSTAVAQVIGSPLAAGILMMDGVLGLAGWQWLFVIEGFVAVVFGVVLYVFLPRPGDCYYEVVHDQGADRMAKSESFDDGKRRHREVFLSALCDWRTLYLAGCFFSIMQAMYANVFFIPMMIHKIFSPSGDNGYSVDGTNTTSNNNEGCLGGQGESTPLDNDNDDNNNSATMVALLSMLPFATAAIAMVIVGRRAEVKKERRYHASIPVILGAMCMYALALSMTLDLSIISFIILTLAAAAIWSHHGPFVSWPAEYMDRETATISFAIINSFGSLGGFLGPTILGILAQATGGYSVALVCLASILLCGGVAILFFRPSMKHRGMGSHQISVVEDEDGTVSDHVEIVRLIDR